MADPFTEHSLGYVVNRLARVFTNTAGPRMSRHGVNPGQLPVLLTLWEHQPRTQADLARAIGVEQPTMAATLQRMERDELITRTPDPKDGRRSLIALTERAHRLEAPIKAELLEINTLATTRLTGREVEAFFAIVSTMTHTLIAARDADGTDRSGT